MSSESVQSLTIYRNYEALELMLYNEFRKGDRPRQTVLLFIHSLSIMLCALIDVGICSHFIVSAYIDHNDGLGSPILYRASIVHDIPGYVILDSLVILVLDTLINAMEVWRIWVFWSASPYHLYATGTSFFVFLSALGIETAYFSGCFVIKDLGKISGSVVNALGIAVPIVDTVFSLLAFFLIAGRLYITRRYLGRLLGTAHRPSVEYTSIMAMLAESYALRAVSSVSYAAVFATSSIQRPALSLFAIMNDHAKVIAYLLVLYRVLSTRAWKQDTVHHLSTLQWNHEQASTVVVSRGPDKALD
ncbi:hypothetical protein D9756_011566 [Leucocoprinus leucothites]|uniref:Uncharacterized protein n=1 Tax=Leucocoprinus leucothites TaxID=201217 RepID=A0A8H5CNN3_9AGAR|nr:hypothetical protein D9756_011566 [Leucoagaricus leucothites]